MKENIIIGFVTASDPTDKKSWSGIHYRMWKALEDEFSDVVLLGPMPESFTLRNVLRIKTLLHKMLFRKRYNTKHNRNRSRYYSRIISNRLKQGTRVDVIFAPVASVEIAYLKTEIPICYLSDTSFAQINGYYRVFSNLSKRSERESNAIEQAAIDKSAVVIYSSRWAASFAESYYHAKNTTVIKFGANLENVPPQSVIKKNYDSAIRILFMGTDWVRKGGSIVLETLDLLSRRYPDIVLTVCGCIPPVSHPRMNVIPFIDKGTEDGQAFFEQLMEESHLLFMPTRADCTPIVFCEANAYAIPVVTTDTGGVADIITNGVNGFVLPLSASGPAYADQIRVLIDDRAQLRAMAERARNCFENELNWSHWSARMRDLLIELLPRDKKPLLSKNTIPYHE